MKRVAALALATVSIAFVGACSSSDDGAVPAQSTPTVPPESAPASVAEASADTLYKVTVVEDGSTTRFDSCAGPIKILFNAGDLKEQAAPYTDVDVIAQLDELFTQTAKELSDMTGLDIQYGGTTDLDLNPDLQDSQVILIKLGATGFPGRESEASDQLAIYGKKTGEWLQIKSFQYFENSYSFAFHYESAAKAADGSRDIGIDDAGRRSLKTVLGEALGLSPLIEDDMVSAGVPTDKHADQVMYTDSHVERDGSYNLTWGDGDKAGFALVGSKSGCF